MNGSAPTPAPGPDLAPAGSPGPGTPRPRTGTPDTGTPEADDGTPGTPTRTSLVLAVLALSGLGGSLLQTMASPALPAMSRALGTSVADTSWALTALLLSAAITTPIVGRLGHLIGTRRAFVAVLVVVMTGALTSALAPVLPVLVIGQVLQGVAGGVFPLAFSTIRHVFPEERRPSSIGLLSGLLGIGAGVGLVVSGLIVDTVGYRFIFWIPLAALAVALAAVLAWLPDVPPNAHGGLDAPSALLMALGFGGLLFALTRTSTWGWTAPATIGIAAGALALLQMWVRRENRSSEPLVDMRTMRVRTVWATNLAGFFLGAAMFGAFILIPQFAQSEPTVNGYGFDAGVTQAGLLLAPLTLAMLVAAPLAGRAAHRFGSRAAVLFGAVAAVLAYAVLIPWHDSIPAVLAAASILGLGIGAAYAAMANLIVDAVPADQTGVAAGVNTLSRQIGSAVGSSVAATVLAGTATAGGAPSPGGFTAAFTVALAAAAAAVVAAALIPPRPGRPGTTSR